MNAFMIYTDGSYNPRYPEWSGWAFIILNSDEEIVMQNYGKVKCESRQVDGECAALVEAMRWLDEHYELNRCVVNIYYDYTGVEQWSTNKWKTNKNVSITFKQNIQPLLNKTSVVCWHKVKSHTNNKWNDKVDELCKYALLR